MYKPDLVVSVHPLMQHVPIRVLRDRIKAGTLPPINFATVVTDFTTCHNTWFCPQATRVFVPTGGRSTDGPMEKYVGKMWMGRPVCARLGLVVSMFVLIGVPTQTHIRTGAVRLCKTYA